VGALEVFWGAIPRGLAFEAALALAGFVANLEGFEPLQSYSD